MPAIQIQERTLSPAPVRKTRVAVFTDNDFSKVTGVTTTLRALLDHAPADIKPRIYTCETRGIDSPDYLGVKAIGVGIPFYRDMKMYAPPFRQFLRKAERDAIDLVHLTTPGPVGLAAMYVASRLGVPMVGSFHTDLVEYARLLSGSERLARAMAEYLRWPYSRCERIFVPSESTRDLLIAAQIDASKLRIWRRGVSTTLFSPAKRSSSLRRQWGVNDGQLALLYVGRLSREKGLAMLGPLSTSLTLARVPHRLVIAGDGPMRTELQAMCPDAVFTGMLSRDDVARVMASADLFVFPSRTDTAGNVVLEAQASGLPVLVTDAGGPKENMSHGETGYICSDPETFILRTCELAGAPALRAGMAHSAHEYALRRSWDEALVTLYRQYRELAADKWTSGLE